MITPINGKFKYSEITVLYIVDIKHGAESREFIGLTPYIEFVLGFYNELK